MTYLMGMRLELPNGKQCTAWLDLDEELEADWNKAKGLKILLDDWAKEMEARECPPS